MTDATTSLSLASVTATTRCMMGECCDRECFEHGLTECQTESDANRRRAATVFAKQHPEWEASPRRKQAVFMEAAIRFLGEVADPASPTREELDAHIESLRERENNPIWGGPARQEVRRAITAAAEDLRRCF
jgi:hypothetical protein